MSKSRRKVALRGGAELEKLAEEFDQEMAGAVANTEPLSAEELRWYRTAVADTGPKVKVTIRLRKWQIERARELAKERGLRGYQTLLGEVITRGLLP